VAAWRHPARGTRDANEQYDRLARLEPLDPPPEPHPLAHEIARRLTTTYAFDQFASTAAARAATDPADGPKRSGTLKISTLLDRAGDVGADAVGTATHLVLQHLDFTRPCDRADLAAQLEQLVDRRLLPAAMAPRVDADALVWFLSSDLGALLRRHSADVLRELPIYAATPAAPGAVAADPSDQVMLRGRLDALLPLADRSVLIDYKTDAVTSEGAAARAALYRPQVISYVSAIERMTGKPAAGKLVFLRARTILDV
jgi:ATP-dependent helicase/nuclease subunit A